MAKKYRIKGDAASFVHPEIGTVTKEHMSTMHDAVVKAIQVSNKKKVGKPVEAYLEEVK